MDTSKEYIKMCEKAVEVQENWKRNFGDYAWKGEDYLCIPDACIILNDGTQIIPPYGDKLIFLPRQDQLQGMIKDTYQSSLVLSCALYHWIMKLDLRESDSMEQLWLAFVMKEKFNKTWNGEDWK